MKQKNWKPFVFGLLWIGLAFAPAMALAQEPQRAAVVVHVDEEMVAARCVAFDEPQISGYELLLRSGLLVESNVAGMGVAVCRIEETGCPPNDCFCHCRGGGDCAYWSYWHFTEGSWQYARAGASAYQVNNGMVDGWVWGPGSAGSVTELPLTTFEEVCEAPEAEATAVATPDRAIPWFSYLVFGLIISGLGLLLFVARRGQETG